MSQSLDKIKDRAPKGFWKELRGYDQKLYEEGVVRASYTENGEEWVGWQWLTRNVEASREAIVARPVHLAWWSVRSLGGLITGIGVESALRVTDVLPDLETPLSDQETLPATSKLFAYDINLRLMHFPTRFGGPYLKVVPATHKNIRDVQQWDQETHDATMATVAEAETSIGSRLLAPTPEDYELVLHYMELGAEAEDRRPLINQS